ncbi:unnamed protein product [Rotaria sp. Silwood1]|nr:unnamed protein product [Rotaria sp. Silwood1]CAF3474735.1 unnamed protein product [Rotaria sp. Silwood1]CAF4520870.1 unnamed protein product [Rotaria sp. Silwood1]CAF4732233.1 unnamed protein product [Rotaria sp. Silwood1]
MTDNSSAPIDLRIKRKRDDIDEYKSSTKKKSRNNHEYEIPLDLSIKSQQQEQHHVFNPKDSPSTPSSSSTTIPFYDPTNLLFNSSALLYDLFLANLNSYYQQQQQQQQQQLQQRVNIEPSVPTSKPTKQQTINSSRNIKDNSTSKQESYACSCGEKYSNVAHLVSHLKITNHNAQLSSTHDEVAKLVRGQDIWLSRDTNPANQILKCLRCSLSFETLPDLTAHMMKTNHFTQLLPSSSSSSSTTTTTPSTSVSYHHSNSKQQQQQQQHSPTKLLNPPSLIRSTCLICSQQFAREVDLVDHIQHYHQIRFNCTTCGMYFENENLYKEHILKEMHHRNGKANRNRDYFLNQCKTLQKRSLITKTERPKSRSSIDKDVEQVTLDLIDRIVKNEEESKELTTKTTTATTNANALSLLQNFVIKQTPTTNRQSDLNNNYDDENTNLSQNEKSLSSNLYHHEKISNNLILKSNESPLVSLEKMLSYPTTTIQSLSSTINDNGTMSNLSNNSIMTIKKKKFDKYRLFAEKMLRSTLS